MTPLKAGFIIEKETMKYCCFRDLICEDISEWPPAGTPQLVV